MILTLEDLKNTDFWLPKDGGQGLPKKMGDMGNQFLLFYYKFNDNTSLIEDITGLYIIDKPKGSDYKNKPSGYSIGYLKAPFDTQNVLFYQFLRFYYLFDRGGVSAETKERVKNEKALKDFFLECKKQDLEAIDVKNQNTVYNNIFKIYGRDSMLSAINNYLDNSDSKAIDTVISICDMIDGFLRTTKNKSFYLDYVDKVVTAMKNPNGGLISETGNELRYLYSGENSTFNQNDEKLEEAKQMKRNKFSINEIYLKTNWFYNKYDHKWRKRIEDFEVKVPTLKNGTLFMNSTSNFISKREEVYKAITSSPNMPYGKISQFLADGYDVVLGNIIEHPTLFKHYPKLFNMPVFYANSHRVPSNRNDNSYAFYYTSDDHYLMLCGHSDHFDLKTVMLHEIQHAIQRIEGFGTGGNLDLSEMITSVGGENVKNYFFLRGAITKKIGEQATTVGRYNYSSYSSHFLGMKGSFNIALPKEVEYYDKIKSISGELIALYLQGSTAQRKEISDFLGSEITEDLNRILKFKEESQAESNRLIGIGYSENAIYQLFFSTYEALAGEVESRDVQHSTEIDVELKDYLLPMTSESVQDEKVTVIIDDFMTEEKLPKDIKGAVEINKEGKYIIHLYKSLTAIPFLHELGHIVHDFIGKEKIDETIYANFTKETIEEYVNVEEIFCELFICYLIKQNFSEEFNYDIGDDFKLMSSDIPFIKNELDAIFYPKENKEQDKEFMDRLLFVSKLNNYIDNEDFFKTEKTEEEKEQTVTKETAQGTEDVFAVGDVVYLPNRPQSDNYGEIVGIKNGVAELEVRNEKGIERIFLTIDELIKIENPYAENYEFFYEGSVAYGKYLTESLATNLLAENVGSVIYVANLKRNIMKGFKSPKHSSRAIFLLSVNKKEIVFVYANQPTSVFTLNIDNISDIKIPTEEETFLVFNLTKKETSNSEKQKSASQTNPTEIINLSQLKKYLQIGTVLRVSYNRNSPNSVGKMKVVAKVQTNGVYFALGTEVPESEKGLSYFEYPKSSNIVFKPTGFETNFIDREGIVVTNLGYDYVLDNEQASESNQEVVVEEAETEIPAEKPKPILTYHCSYKGKSIEIIAKSMYDAQVKAVPLLKANPKKGWEVSVHLVAIDGVEQLQSTAFEKGGNTN